MGVAPNKRGQTPFCFSGDEGSVTNNLLAVASKFSRPRLGDPSADGYPASVFRFPHRLAMYGRESGKSSKFCRRKISPLAPAQASPSTDGTPAFAFDSLIALQKI